MNRQKARQRMNQYRMKAPIENMPSVEESLQSWLSRDKTISTICLPELCLCCQRTNCENLEGTIFTIRKLEEEGRLAAEIGQILLYKHEQYLIESSQITSSLEEQLFQAQEKARHLENLLIQSDNVIDDLELERNKFAWEYEKSQKALDRTLQEVDNCQQRSNQLVLDLNTASKEVEKLKSQQFLINEAEIREENLRAELEEVRQELAVSKKAEHAMESKYKKLKLKYEKSNNTETDTDESNNNVSANDNKLNKDIKDSVPLVSQDQPPAHQLSMIISSILGKLQQTDINILYRKLCRAFDIFDLSSMSNSLVENIMASDVDALSLFSKDNLQLASLVLVIQEMFKEISLLRISMNDIQLDYMKNSQDFHLVQKEDTLDWFHNTRCSVSQRRASLPCSTFPTRKDSSRLTRLNLPPSSTASRSSFHKRRLAITYPLRLSPSAAALQKSIKKRKSLLVM